MPWTSPTTFATLISLLIAVLTAVMGYLGWRSFQRTRNPRLVFVVGAFVTFLIKSLFVAYNLQTHAVPHDSIELVGALFDVLIVMLLFLPFFLDTGG